MVLLRTCSWKPAFPYSLGCDKISGHHYSINSCLADRRTRLMRDKESIYASHLENIVILRKQRYTWVAGTLLKGKALASTSFSLSHKKSAQMGFTRCNDSGGSSHSRSPLADWSMFSDVMLTASICQHNSGVVLSGKGPIRKVFFLGYCPALNASFCKITAKVISIASTLGHITKQILEVAWVWLQNM